MGRLEVRDEGIRREKLSPAVGADEPLQRGVITVIGAATVAVAVAGRRRRRRSSFVRVVVPGPGSISRRPPPLVAVCLLRDLFFPKMPAPQARHARPPARPPAIIRTSKKGNKPKEILSLLAGGFSWLCAYRTTTNKHSAARHPKLSFRGGSAHIPVRKEQCNVYIRAVMCCCAVMLHSCCCFRCCWRAA